MAFKKMICMAAMLLCGIFPCIAQEENILPSDSLVVEEINGFTVTWAKEATEEQKTVLRELINNMVKVEGGEFTMGSDKYWNGHLNPFRFDETPAHKETVGDFHINKYELRYSEWKVLMGNKDMFGGYRVDPDWYIPDQPIVNFIYAELLEYIRKLNALTGLTFRLPREAEWEYAAKGGKFSKGYIFSGSDIEEEVSVSKGEPIKSLYEPPCRVGSKKPNELGLYDMSGNVSEWVSDVYWSYDPAIKLDDDSIGILRGGDYKTCDLFVTNTKRTMCTYGISGCSIGFRLAL